MMVVAEFASAGHVRPKAAQSNPGVARSGVQAVCQHRTGRTGRRWRFPSCNPPVQASSSLTIGEPTDNGATANGVAFVKLKVKVGVPGPPDDSDVPITASGTDIRCRSGVTTCGSANAVDGADYTGQLQGTAHDPDLGPLQRCRGQRRVRPRHGDRPSVPVDDGLYGYRQTHDRCDVHRQHVGQRNRAGSRQGRQAVGRRDRPAAGLRRRTRRSRRHRPRTSCSPCRASSFPDADPGLNSEPGAGIARSRPLLPTVGIADVRVQTTGLISPRRWE